jgi:hypothetical protein
VVTPDFIIVVRVQLSDSSGATREKPPYKSRENQISVPFIQPAILSFVNFNLFRQSLLTFSKNCGNKAGDDAENRGTKFRRYFKIEL